KTGLFNSAGLSIRTNLSQNTILKKSPRFLKRSIFIAGVAFFGIASLMLVKGVVAGENKTELTVNLEEKQQTFLTNAKTVGEALKQEGVIVSDYDICDPKENAPLKGEAVEVVITPAHPITIIDGSFSFQTLTSYNTVERVLEQLGIKLLAADMVIPPLDHKVEQGSRIIITRSPLIHITDGNKKYEVSTLRDTVGGLIKELDVTLKGEDRIEPAKKTVIKPGLRVTIVRVKYQKKTVKEDIDYETVYKDDASLIKGKTEVAQEGKTGRKRSTYKLKVENGVEVSRELVNSITTITPVDKIVKRGTKVPVGTVMYGKASWWNGGGGMTTAARDFAVGTQLRVTNTENGKQVVVTVNGWGPQSYTGRILDLNSDAFSAIASLGEGVVNIKLEELL
ncbi:ubiquitin-like domain-containing protein, partial [Patescibacteria group bacterium]